MRSDGPCGPCSRGVHSRLRSIGEAVEKDSAFGQGFARSRLEFAQCPTCGSLWLTTTEVGPGREELSHIRLTRCVI